ncbi:MAG: hypothetical protein IPN34_22090 [Planctomycetes bacterium]|nr:hypothetical protein [Planctomycetota bacterium]
MLIRSILGALLLSCPAWAQLPPTAFYVTRGFGHQIYSYTVTGAPLRSLPVPYPILPIPATEYVRDVTVHPSGDLYVYNGTAAPFLSIYRSRELRWEHYSDPRWSTNNVLGLGNVVLFRDQVFVHSFASRGGLFRFDTVSRTFTHFATDAISGFGSIALGQDGLLYAREGDTDSNVVQVFDPITLARLRTIRLPVGDAIRTLAVTPRGEILGVRWLSGELVQYDPQGNPQRTMLLPVINNYADLNLGPCGEIALGNRFGYVALTDISFSAPQVFRAGTEMTMLAFARTDAQPLESVATIRLGVPPNPQVYHLGLARPPALGSRWQAWVNPGLVPSPIADFLLIAGAPLELPLREGTLLVDPSAAGILLSQPTGLPFFLTMPDDCTLLGHTIYTQAGSLNATEFGLGNAIDLLVGHFQRRP